jgi:hypothetical protein
MSAQAAIMERKNPIVWRCSGGHALGIVVRNGSGRSQLLLYRKAIGRQEAEEVDVMALVDGLVLDVKCSVCGRMRTWSASPAEWRGEASG